MVLIGFLDIKNTNKVKSAQAMMDSRRNIFKLES